jgi:hypothetical protein
LECCVSSTTSEACDGCPLNIKEGCETHSYLLESLALDIINRQKAEKEAVINGQETLQKYIAEQKAEIERLTCRPPKDPMDFCGVVCKYAEELIEKAKAEAIKEFVERLYKLDSFIVCNGTYITDFDDILKLRDEMVGDNDD